GFYTFKMLRKTTYLIRTFVLPEVMQYPIVKNSYEAINAHRRTIGLIAIAGWFLAPSNSRIGTGFSYCLNILILPFKVWMWSFQYAHNCYKKALEWIPQTGRDLGSLTERQKERRIKDEISEARQIWVASAKTHRVKQMNFLSRLVNSIPSLKDAKKRIRNAR